MDLLGTAGGLWSNRQNREFAEEMASTQYQRSVKDMKAAGLNPNAVFGSGGGSQAAAPGGQSDNPVRGELGSSVKNVADIANTLTQMKQTKADTANKEQQNELMQAQTDTARASARAAQSQSDVVTKENAAYSRALDSKVGQGVAAFNKFAGPAMGLLSGAGGAVARGIGNWFGGRSSAKQPPLDTETFYDYDPDTGRKSYQYTTHSQKGGKK